MRSFHEDPLLCPVNAVVCYNNKVTTQISVFGLNSNLMYVSGWPASS